jgi:hypothetical protein
MKGNVFPRNHRMAADFWRPLELRANEAAYPMNIMIGGEGKWVF